MSERPQSLETIFNFQNRDVPSQWSVVWSTTHIPNMDNAAGGMGRHPVHGRRRLHIGALTLGAFLTMHCRIAAAALTGGFFIFMFFLILAVALLANPLRHFEVYLGQWSISGPGRAFRIIPMLDGIGIAICINAIVRAITCCTIAAIAVMYVVHSVRDEKLPFTYCRDFDLKPYNPVFKDWKTLLREIKKYPEAETDVMMTTVGIRERNFKNYTYLKYVLRQKEAQRRKRQQIPICNETYGGSYPTLYNTPPYNFFYVEILSLRSDFSFTRFNVPLGLCILLVWAVLWILLTIERFTYQRMVWNNIHLWLVAVPWLWVVLLLTTAIANVTTVNRSFKKHFRTTTLEAVVILSDAVECALYIHSASMGTELIHGKGLNHYGRSIIGVFTIKISEIPYSYLQVFKTFKKKRYIWPSYNTPYVALASTTMYLKHVFGASGHIDPNLNSENVLHSGLMLLLTALYTGAASLCAFVDCAHPSPYNVFNKYESTLWILPLYSKCALVGNYKHLLSALLFGGLTFSYMTVAYILLKTALHTIFEYRVKLVFKEQAVVAVLILSCTLLSLILATNGGIVLLESVDSIMTGLSTPYVCLLELIGLLYVYRGHDFESDIHVATEENTCSTRIATQWRIIPFITFIALILKMTAFKHCELPDRFMYLALIPLLIVVFSVPVRAACNAYSFLRAMWLRKKG